MKPKVKAKPVDLESDPHAFLSHHGIPHDEIDPPMFGKSAKQLGFSFDKLLRFISLIYMGGQNAELLRNRLLLKS